MEVPCNIEVRNRTGLDGVLVIGIENQITEIDFSMDKTIEKGHNMVRIIKEEMLGEETIEEYKILKNKLLEGNIEVTKGIII